MLILFYRPFYFFTTPFNKSFISLNSVFKLFISLTAFLISSPCFSLALTLAIYILYSDVFVCTIPFDLVSLTKLSYPCTFNLTILYRQRYCSHIFYNRWI